MMQWLNILFSFLTEKYSVFLTPNAGISRFDFSNSYIWFEFYNAPLAKDISLICDVRNFVLWLYFVVHSPWCTYTSIRIFFLFWIWVFVDYSSMAHCGTSWGMQCHEHASKFFSFSIRMKFSFSFSFFFYVCSEIFKHDCIAYRTSTISTAVTVSDG